MSVTGRSAVTLSDGRELFYYDDAWPADADAAGPADAGRARHHATDSRGLRPTVPASQIRWDRMFSEWSVIAGHRQARTYKPPTSDCPLCPSRDGRATEIPDSDYDVAVFENRFPSLASGAADAVEAVADGPFVTRPGVGRCEVVCFTSDHDSAFARLPPERVRTVLDALADRTQAISSLPGVEYVLPFENRGEEIGVTLAHPHGQIYGYPFVPPRLRVAAANAAVHFAATGRSLQGDILDQELTDGSRIVTRSEHTVAYVPFAARWPYEVTIVPRRHVLDLAGLTGAERDDLARLYLDVLQRFDGLFSTPAPYIAAWQQAPVRENRQSWHLSASVFTIRRADAKLKYLAGSESAAAVWINDISPETAARRLREAGPAELLARGRSADGQ